MGHVMNAGPRLPLLIVVAGVGAQTFMAVRRWLASVGHLCFLFVQYRWQLRQQQCCSTLGEGGGWFISRGGSETGVNGVIVCVRKLRVHHGHEHSAGIGSSRSSCFHFDCTVDGLTFGMAVVVHASPTVEMCVLMAFSVAVEHVCEEATVPSWLFVSRRVAGSACVPWVTSVM